MKKGANGEECLVLVRRLYVAGDDIGTWYLIKKTNTACTSVGEKCKEAVEGSDGGGQCESLERDVSRAPRYPVRILFFRNSS